MARGEGVWLRSLTAVSPSGEYMGCKLIAANTRARRASYLISLFDQQTMELRALIDGNRVTGLRTAATAALAILHGLDHEQAEGYACTLDPEDLGRYERFRDPGITHQDVGDGAVHIRVTTATRPASRS